MKSIAVAALLGSAQAGFFAQMFGNQDELMTAQEYQFMAHLVEFGKSYGTREEYQFRLALFKENLA